MKNIGYDSYTSWFVTACCTIISCFSESPYRINGLIFVLIIENYETDRLTASIPIVLFISIRCFGGPVFGVLGEKFGVEVITIVGCVLAAVGVGTCFFAENIGGVILLLGMVYGVGSACSTAFIPYILKKNFTENIFNTVNGISRAGPCLGALFIPPTILFLIDLYGVAGAFLILSSILFHSLPVGIYIQRAGKKQDNIIRLQTQEVKKFKMEEKGKIDTEQQINIDTFVAVTKISENIRYPVDTECPDTENQKVLSVLLKCQVPQNHEQQEKDIDAFNVELGPVKKDGVGFEFLPPSKGENQSFSKISINTITEKAENVKNATNSHDNLQLEKTSTDKRKKFFDSFRVFKNISFLTILLNIGLTKYITTLFWTTMIDYCRDKGISRNSEIYFLMMQPLVDLIGRTCFGWLTDLGYLTLSNFAVLSYGQMALSMIVMMWTNQFWVMMVGVCWYALVSGAIATVYPGIIFKCVDKDHQAMAIASRFAIYGVLVFTSSPLIGYFRENLGSYDGLYCLFIVLCIVCAAVIPLMFKFTKHDRTKMPNKS